MLAAVPRATIHARDGRRGGFETAVRSGLECPKQSCLAQTSVILSEADREVKSFFRESGRAPSDQVEMRGDG